MTKVLAALASLLLVLSVGPARDTLNRPTSSAAVVVSAVAGRRTQVPKQGTATPELGLLRFRRLTEVSSSSKTG
jgi:hypothetical protein